MRPRVGLVPYWVAGSFRGILVFHVAGLGLFVVSLRGLRSCLLFMDGGQFVRSQRRLDLATVGGGVIDRFPFFGDVSKIRHDTVHSFAFVTKVSLLRRFTNW